MSEIAIRVDRISKQYRLGHARKNATLRDTLTGAAGADVLRGMQGSDLLEARDLTSDQAIDCDGSGTRSAADRADLDMLPKDPNSVVKGCETKMRH